MSARTTSRHAAVPLLLVLLLHWRPIQIHHLCPNHQDSNLPNRVAVRTSHYAKYKCSVQVVRTRDREFEDLIGLFSLVCASPVRGSETEIHEGCSSLIESSGRAEEGASALACNDGVCPDLDLLMILAWRAYLEGRRPDLRSASAILLYLPTGIAESQISINC